MADDFESLVYKDVILFDEWPFQKKLRYSFSRAAWRRGWRIFSENFRNMLSVPETIADAVVFGYSLLMLGLLLWAMATNGQRPTTATMFVEVFADIARPADLSC